MTTAEAITLALGGRWTHGRGSAFCPAHENRRTPALSLADGEAGRMLLFCFSGCTYREIVAALRSKGVYIGASGKVGASSSCRSATRPIPVRNDGLTNALRLWWLAAPVEGTLVESYLDGRGVGLPFSTEALRFAPKCWHSAELGHLPAMLAKVERDGEIVAVQRTYLRPPGCKADVSPQRKTLGRAAGGAVKLSDACGPLVVAEGVETALAFDTEYARVWATLGAAGMAKLQLPAADVSTFNDLTIAADGDDPGLRAAQALATRAKRLGWNVMIHSAPAGFDWADVALRDARKPTAPGVGE